MRISDNMTLVRKKTGTNVATFPDAEMLLYYKTFLPQFQVDIGDTNEGYGGSIEWRDLIATDEGTYVDDSVTYLTREYNLPLDMMNKLHMVNAKLDGDNWVTLKNYDMNDLDIPFEETNILAEFNHLEGVAGYTIFRKGLFLLTGEIEATVTDGLKIWTYSFISPFATVPTTGSDEDVELEIHGIPEEMQELLAIYIASEWKSNKKVPVPLTASEVNRYIVYKERLKGLQNLDRNKVRSYKRPANKYGNGFDL